MSSVSCQGDVLVWPAAGRSRRPARRAARWQSRQTVTGKVHRNGVRDDNRPQNLELWTRPQPSGIRVGDAVEWARAILDR